MESKDPKKRKKAEEDYSQTLGKPLPINIRIVKENTKELAGIIKNTISPVVIRRNRLVLC